MLFGEKFMMIKMLVFLACAVLVSTTTFAVDRESRPISPQRLIQTAKLEELLENIKAQRAQQKLNFSEYLNAIRYLQTNAFKTNNEKVGAECIQILYEFYKNPADFLFQNEVGSWYEISQK